MHMGVHDAGQDMQSAGVEDFVRDVLMVGRQDLAYSPVLDQQVAGPR
jgi:hypothetical protein